MLQTVFIAFVLGQGYPGQESRADYLMDVRLFPDSNEVVGFSEITFSSGATNAVDTLWLHLYPNAYRDHETPFGRDLDAVGRYGFRASDRDERGWIELWDWTLNGEPIEVLVDDCIGYVPLDDPLQPSQEVVLRGSFSVHIPRFWSRMGRSGSTYQITQWYPKMCVLDADGWHLGRYRWRGEFYSDFGTYEVNLTLPDSFVTAATGSIRTVSYSPDSTLRTETWNADRVHDFVWSASPDYTVRDHLFNYPETLGGKGVSIHLVLLDDDPDHWSDVPATIDSTLLYYGQWYVPYPYSDLWVVEPVTLMAGGMEYPQFIFSGAEIPMTRALEMVTAHEVGHQWFYGMLASDEVDEAWLDEGMNTFSELRYMERRYGFDGNMTTTPDWFLQVSDQDMNLLTYVQGTSREEVPVLSRATDAGDGSHSTGFTYYAKPALFMRMMQMQLGDTAFDSVMTIYTERFMFHHPHTEDFQSIVEEVTGRSWQEEFDFWLRGTGSADVRIERISCHGDSTEVIMGGDVPHSLELDLLLIRNDDSLLTTVTMEPGTVSRVSVPGNWTMAVADPFIMFPDRAPWNNSAPVRSQLRPLIIPFPRPTHYSLWLLPFPSYEAGSWTGNIVGVSAPVTSYMAGPYTWTGRLSIPFESDGYTAWGSYCHVPLSRSARRTLSLSIGIDRGYGIGRTDAGIDYLVSGRVPADPRYGMSLGAGIFSVEDTTVYGSANVEEGRSLEFRAGLAAADENYRLSWTGSTEILVSPGWEDEAYTRLDLEMNFTTRVFGGMLLRTRLYAGRIAGGAPKHVLLRPGGGLFAGGAIGSFIPPDGTLSPLEHYYVREGPALPGYWNSGIRGRAALVLEQRIPLPMPILPVEAYFASGWIANGPEDFSGETFLADVGLAVRLAMLEMLFPLWVSDPSDGEEEWEFRWRVGLSPAGFPDLY